MKLSTTSEQNLQGTTDLASAEAMANEAIRVAEALIWAIYGSDEVAHAGAVAGVLHT
jgi:hypothetical protein